MGFPEKKYITEQFFEQANFIHNNKYDYSYSKYTNLGESIVIFCKKHKCFFKQHSGNHLKGYGCRFCSEETRNKFRCLTSLADKLSSIYCDSDFDFNLIKFNGNFNFINIFCINCSDYITVNIKKFLGGCGCYTCYKKNEFLEKAKILHQNKYDYSQINYVARGSKVNIFCPVHQTYFLQTPNKHLQKRGCPLCKGTLISEKLAFNTDYFINQAIKIHGNKYDYSLVEYINIKTKIKIKCNKCNQIFEQAAENHLNGKGCSHCAFCRNSSNQEKHWLDCLKIPEEYRQKILTIGNKKFRLDAFDPTTNTIYEFNGDFWHGNPKVYHKNDVNCRNGKTFGELYKETIAKAKYIKKHGYNLISIWESDWQKLNHKK